jgi:hypothetical protein
MVGGMNCLTQHRTDSTRIMSMYDLKTVPYLSDYPRNHCRRLATACLAWAHQSSELFICAQKKTRCHAFVLEFINFSFSTQDFSKRTWEANSNVASIGSTKSSPILLFQRTCHISKVEFLLAVLMTDSQHGQVQRQGQQGTQNSRCGSRFPASR